MKFKIVLFVLLIQIFCQAQTVSVYKKMNDGIIFDFPDGKLKISSLANNAVRIRFYKDEESKLPELVFKAGKSSAEFKIVDSPSKIELKNKKIIINLDKQTGTLSFTDNTGKLFLT